MLTIPAIIIALIVSVIPALIVGYGAARLGARFRAKRGGRFGDLVRGGFVVTYGASAYALIAWWV